MPKLVPQLIKFAELDSPRILKFEDRACCVSLCVVITTEMLSTDGKLSPYFSLKHNKQVDRTQYSCCTSLFNNELNDYNR
jgi:hypothetical protein